jgi:hypothetical protein
MQWTSLGMLDFSPQRAQLDYPAIAQSSCCRLTVYGRRAFVFSMHDTLRISRHIDLRLPRSAELLARAPFRRLRLPLL